MTESIQNDMVECQPTTDGGVGTLWAGRSTATRSTRSDRQLDFWRFAAEQYGIWLDDEQWSELADLDDNLLIARRYFWRLSDPEVHELLCAVPDSHE